MLFEIDIFNSIGIGSERLEKFPTKQPKICIRIEAGNEKVFQTRTKLRGSGERGCWWIKTEQDDDGDEFLEFQFPA